MYTLSSNSVADKNKINNGDYLLHEFLSSENILVLVLSDGVGSRACDHVASQTACSTFMEAFKNCSDGVETSERFRNAIKEANRLVSSPPQQCHGMMATLVAVVWPVDCDFFYYSGIGDSRVYLYHQEKVIQISEDQKKAFIRRDKFTKKIIYSAGTPVIDC